MTNSCIKQILDKGYLISPDVTNLISDENVQVILNKLNNLDKKPFIIDINLLNSLLQNRQSVQTAESSKDDVIILKSYPNDTKKYTVQDFVLHFKKRYESLKDILINRQELKNTVSINRITSNLKGEKVAVIGLIKEKSETKNGNLILTIEDVTGEIKVLINKDKKELCDLGKTCLLDECVGITGSVGEGIIFTDKLLFPDVPIVSELKKCPNDDHVLFLGDIHFGIKNFLSNEFDKFILWLNGEYGSDQQKELASKVKYIIIVGDLVEGVGIYPNQEKDLEINDIYLQYEGLANLLKKIPVRIKIIICGGNHDAVRMSEPQPQLDIKYSKPLYDLSNVCMVSNPAMISLSKSEEFSGINVLMYHGFSMPIIADLVEEIRIAGGQGRSDLIMKYLIQRRHLCPMHGINLYVPDPKEDPLVINTVPDMFVTGHIHRVSVSMYKSINLINASCWGSQTDDQEKRGIIPDPGRVVVVNLKTREGRIINFCEDG